MKEFSFCADDAREYPRCNFDTLSNATFTTFQVLTGENWNEPFQLAVQAIGMPSAFLYFVLLVVLSSWVALNLFLAILIDVFTSDNEEKLRKETFLQVPPLPSQRDAACRGSALRRYRWDMCGTRTVDLAQLQR